MLLKKEKKSMSFMSFFDFHEFMICFRALSSATGFDMYFGLLFMVDDYRVYGTYTNTHQKIVIICDFENVDNTAIKEVLSTFNIAFLNAAQNPFQEIDSPLVSKKLDVAVQQIILRHNSSRVKKRP
jgi:hypothetical protein